MLKLHQGSGRHFAFYTDERLHQSLGYRPPADVCRDTTARKG